MRTNPHQNHSGYVLVFPILRSLFYKYLKSRCFGTAVLCAPVSKYVGLIWRVIGARVLREVASAAVGSVLAQSAVTLTQLAWSRCLRCFWSRSNGNHFWCMCKSFGAREVDGVSLPRRLEEVRYGQLWMYARGKLLNAIIFFIPWSWSFKFGWDERLQL